MGILDDSLMSQFPMYLIQFLVPAIAIVLAALLLPYVIAHGVAYWITLKRTLYCVSTEPADAEQMPESVQAIFQPLIQELESYGFQLAGCYLVLGVGADPKEKVWGVALHHTSQQIYATLVPRPSENSPDPVILPLYTFFTDDTALVTTNLPDSYRLVSPDPNSVEQELGSVPVATQWQAHQTKLMELSATKPALVLSPDEFITTLERHNRANTNRLVGKGEIYWVQVGESYRFSWWAGLRAVAKVAWGMFKAKQIESQRSEPFLDATSSDAAANASAVDQDVSEFYRQREQKTGTLWRRTKIWLLLGTLSLFAAVYAFRFEPYIVAILVTVLLLHEGGHVLAMKWFGYKDTTMLFIPFLGALATARKDHATLTEKVWISLAGPLPGLLLGIGLTIAFRHVNVDSPDTWFKDDIPWIRGISLALIWLNLFNLLPVYPLDGGQVADLLLFSSNPYLGTAFKGLGVLLMALIGFTNPLFLAFAILIALSLPNSFRIAKLNAQLRRELRQMPSASEEKLVQFLFEKLQAPAYKSIPKAKKLNLVSGLLSSYQDNIAPWTTRVGLSSVYLASLLVGLGGGLYSYLPNWRVWSNAISFLVRGPEVAHRQRVNQQIESADRALQANPDDTKAYAKRGNARLFLKDYEGAIADANQILQHDPNSPEGYQLRGRARQLLGDQKGAIADYNQAIKLRPNEAWNFVSRGHAYLQMKDYQRAIADANQALHIDPQMADAYYLRSGVYQKLGDKVRAAVDLKKAEELYTTQEDNSD